MVRRIGFRVAVVAAIIVFVLLTGITACSDSNVGPQTIVQPESQTSDQHLHSEIEFTDSNDGIWPPQPRDITNVEAIGTNANAQFSASSKFSPVLSDTKIISLVGNNYAALASYAIRDKSSTLIETEFEFYLYDKNEVLTVTVAANTNVPTRYTSIKSHTYQPPESKEEVQKAIKMAATALSQQGFTDHNNLNGTGILAHPNASQSAQSGSSFFSDRKIYVTFGQGGGVLPQYRALVNLSQSVVENSGAMQ